MPENLLIASLERTATHMAYMLEVWSRDYVSLSASTSPESKPELSIKVIETSVQCLARLVAIQKTIIQLKDPRYYFRRKPAQPSSSQPAIASVPAVPSLPPVSSVPALPLIQSVPVLRGVLTTTQIGEFLAATELLYNETATVAAGRGIPMPSLAEIDALALNPSPSLSKISETIDHLHADIKSLPIKLRPPPVPVA